MISIYSIPKSKVRFYEPDPDIKFFPFFCIFYEHYEIIDPGDPIPVFAYVLYLYGIFSIDLYGVSQ